MTLRPAAVGVELTANGCRNEERKLILPKLHLASFVFGARGNCSLAPSNRPVSARLLSPRSRSLVALSRYSGSVSLSPTPPIFHGSIKGNLNLEALKRTPPPKSPNSSHLKHKAEIAPVRLYLRCDLAVTLSFSTFFFFITIFFLGCCTSRCRSASAAHAFARELQSGFDALHLV